ncbi:bacterial membrane flanked domain [Lysobacter enzymogenes]|uniref:Bacterial membrane flanked domain n=1 Tax=Lysobacter enzymogenes TaxID=69 RepID=A0A0S2DAZ8_LYSEN|nr:PH domain-containing protein [Lysobacter enzymogenes]ALN55723.1 bacterial membrane flanked domain [Lysobacter enzymogenes]
MTPIPPGSAFPAPTSADGARERERDEAHSAAGDVGADDPARTDLAETAAAAEGDATVPAYAPAAQAQSAGEPVATPSAAPPDAAPTPPPATTADGFPREGWQRLPARAIPLCTIDISLSLAVVFAIAAVIGGVLTVGRHAGLASGLTGALFGAGIGMWIGFRRYRNTLWRLDDHGFAVRRGVAWQRETIVPLTRVQHLDLKHGPLQRMRRLATLVVHTAGTRHSSVAIDHLDAGDAQRLRERLGRQLDHEDDQDR